jgi:ABC-type glycerol-3-phosphate transport system substrate-binding protein
MQDHRLSRRSALRAGLTASAIGVLGTQGARASSGNRATHQLAPAQTLSGRIVIGTSQNPDQPVKDALAAAYQERQPDVEIVWETADRPAAEYTSWLGTQLAADDIELDIVSANYVDTYAGYVNLDMYRGTMNPYSEQMWDADLNWDFSRALNPSGERVILSTRAVHINWFYNQDLLDQAGVTPPTTWTEFIDVAEKLSAAGITPVGINYDWQLPQWFAEIYFDQYHVDWIETVRSQEGDWNYDPSIDGEFEFVPDDPFIHNKYTYNPQRFYKAVQDGTLRFDTPQVAEIVTNLKAMFPQYATEDLYVTTDTYTKFLQQSVAILADGSWSIGQLRADMEQLSPERLEELEIEAGSVQTFNWGTFENPAMEGDLVLCPPRSVESSSGEYIGIIQKDQAQTDLALDFTMFWLSAVGYQPYLDAQWGQPGFSPSGPLQVLGVEVPETERELFDNLQELGNAEINYNGFWTAGAGGPHIPNLRNLLAEALNGSITPEEYATQLQAYHQDNWDSYLELTDLTQEDIDDPARQPGS